MPDVSLNGIEFRVRGNADQASASVTRLTSKLNGLKSALSGIASSRSGVKAIEDIGKSAKKSTGHLANFVASLKRIAYYRFIRSIIKSIGSAFNEGLKNAYNFSKLIGGDLAKSLDTVATKGLTMKNQLGAAFGGLLTAITPIIIQIINLVTKLAEALTILFAAFSGGGTYLKAKDVWTEWGEAASGAGGAAKEALKYLAPFDELNRLPDNNNGGGGGGGGSNIADMFENMELPGWAVKVQEWTASLSLTITDVLFDWSDLTGEQIAEKVIAGLFGLVGAGVGFILGGVPGAIVGTIVGVSLGIVIDSFIFDHDGTISGDEIRSMVCTALLGLTGGLIGFTLGGVGGAFIGASIGLSLSLIIQGINFFTEGEMEGAMDSLIAGLNIGLGAALGFKLGGVGGAILGATIGFGITFALEHFVFEDTSNWTAGVWAANIVAALAPFAGAAIGLVLGGPGGALLGATIGLGISFAIEKLALLDTSNWDSKVWAANIVSVLGPVAGAAIGLVLGGPGGAVVGATIGLGIAFSLKSILLENATNFGEKAWVANIVSALAPAAGAMIGLVVGGPGGALIGATIGLGITFALSFGKATVEGGQSGSGLTWFMHDVCGLPTDQEIIDWGKQIGPWLAQGIKDMWADIKLVTVDPAKEFGEWLAQSIEDGAALFLAWLQDLPAKFKQAGINAINAMAEPIIAGVNSLIEKINNSGLAKLLGIHLDPIEFELIPNIPDNKLTENYDAAKEKIEARSRANPAAITGALTGLTTPENPEINVTPKFQKPVFPSGSTDTSGNYMMPTSAKFVKRTTDGNFSTDFKSRATFTKRTTNISTDFKSRATFTKRTTNISTEFNSRAKFTKRTTAISTEFNSRAKFVKRTTDISTEFKSSAKFVDRSTAFTSEIDGSGRPLIKSVAKMVEWKNSLSSKPTVAVTGAITGITRATKATGGVYSGGQWRDIEQYASGGMPRGSQLFWAREQGPELVGTLGGNTAVMNNDQIVASVSAGVARAIASIRFQLTGLGTPAGIDTSNGMSEDAMYRAVSRALSEADFGVDVELDGDKVYQKMVNRNNQERRRLGFNPMMAV